MDAGWAFVVCGSFDPIHVSPSWKMLVRKFDYEDLGAVLESVKGFAWDLPVDGKSWAVSCFLESLGELPCDSFTIDSEAGFGGWNERDNFGWF